MRTTTVDAMTLLLFALAFLAVTLARSLWLWRSAGVNPYVIDHGDPLHRFVARVFFVVFAGLLAYCIVIAVAPDAEAGMGLLSWVAGGAAKWVGLVLMAAATVWTGYAQFAMGSSWRIGIPAEAPPLRTD